MKYLRILFALALVPCLLLAQNRPVVIGNSSQPGTFKLSTVTLNTNSGNINLPAGLIITNGTVDLQGTGAFKMSTGAGAAKVMTSDGSGNGTWAASAGSTVSSTNLILGADVALATTYTGALTITNTATTGHVFVNCNSLLKAVTGPAQVGFQILTVQAGTTNTLTETHQSNTFGNNGSIASAIGGYDTLTGTARTYIFRVKVGSTPVALTSTNSSILDSSYVSTNATQMTLINLP